MTGQILPGCCETGAIADEEELQKKILCSIVSRVDRTGNYARVDALHRECGAQIFREIE